jgi:hypothetical protein
MPYIWTFRRSTIIDRIDVFAQNRTFFVRNNLRGGIISAKNILRRGIISAKNILRGGILLIYLLR